MPVQNFVFRFVYFLPLCALLNLLLSSETHSNQDYQAPKVEYVI